MKFQTIIRVLTSMFLICFLMVSTAAAENGDGSGGGSGDPLTLVSSSPASGQKDIPLNSTILLEFSKNVVNMSVKENNASCFSLYQGDQLTAVNVVMADDQMEPEKKRQIVVVPAEPLQPGVLCTLKISPQLTSKSGVSLGELVQISFTTAGAAAETTPPAEAAATEQEGQDSAELNASAADEPDKSDIIAPDEDNEAAELTSQAPDSAEADAADDKAADENHPINPGVVLGAAALIAIVLLGIIRYRKK